MTKKAAEDARYLMDRGYSKESAIRFVSDHYRLPEAQRFMLSRVIVSRRLIGERKAKVVPLEALRGREIMVDGYNVLITVESLIGDRPVYLCDDGFLRDTQGIFRSYKTSDLTDLALSDILELLAYVCPAKTEFLLDQQISMSGRLAESIRGLMADRSIPGMARTAKDVDHQLKTAEAVIATSDGIVIDATSFVVDLPREIAKKNDIKFLVL